MFDKGNDLLSTMNQISPVKRLDVYGNKLDTTNGIAIDASISSSSIN